MPNDMPDIVLAGFSLWVEGRQFPDLEDYWDGNWITVRATCAGRGATSELTDSCIHLSELSRWAEMCEELLAERTPQAELPTMEPYIQAAVERSGESGRLIARITLTPGHPAEGDVFRFAIEASDVRRLIESLQRMLARFPIRGER